MYLTFVGKDIKKYLQKNVNFINKDYRLINKELCKYIKKLSGEDKKTHRIR